MQVLTKTLYALAMTIALMCLSLNSMAQTKVSGTVIDESGLPLPGAGVVESGTSNGTVTDVDGKFAISVKPGASLEISYIGYVTATVAAPADGKNVTVTLETDNNVLNEIVVVGYGSMQRKDITSSITTIKSDNLNKGVFTDAASMLQGKVAGLVVSSTGDPNGTPSITLRGASSLRSGAMSPYYVIDGIPGLDISMVAPDDIESIDVLRDATATAIYGSKAANGVIIITTKKGSLGRENLNVGYSGYVGFDNILKTYDMATASDLRTYASKNNLELRDGGSDTDWQKLVLRTAVSHNHNISINGSGKKTSYMASVNYLDRQGVIKETGMNRINARSLVSSKVLKDHLEFSVGVTAMYGKHFGVPFNDEGASVLDAMNYFSPTNPVRNSDGSYTSGTSSQNYNPLSLMSEDLSETIMKRMQLIGKVTLHIIDGLTWTANYSFDNNQSTYSAYDTHNSQLPVPASKNGQATRNTYFGHNHIFETYGNFDRTFADKHKVGVMVGYSWEEKTSGDGFGLTVHDFYDDNLKWYNLSYASTIDGIPAVQSGIVQTVRNISFYGRLNYSFDSRYSIQATIRRDGSSVFGENHRWGTFPSVSAAWNIAEEPWLKDQDVLSQLKLRVGYGVSGNAMGFDAFTAVATYGATGFFDYNGKQWRTLGATKNANPDLKWESTGMFNAGLDFAFLDGRISGSIEFYNKHTNDLIWNYPVSQSIYPYANIDANVGEITNKGIEFSITAVPVQTKDFYWNTSFNISHNKNVVNRLSNDKYAVGLFTQGDPKVSGVSSNGWVQRVIEGEPLGTFYTYEFAGYEDGKSTYYTRNESTGERDGGTTTTPELKDRTITGYAQPVVNFGWNNSFNYKNWNLTAFFTGVLGGKVYNSARAHYTSAQMFSDGKNALKEFLDRPNGDATSSLPSDRYLENGSYVRLQTLSLGYTFKEFAGWLKSLQIYATANNLLTITSYKGLDPEVNLGGIDPGVDYRWSTYPHTRTFMLGAKINF